MTSRSIRVEVDLDEFDTDDLIEELECRGYTASKASLTVDTIGGLGHVQHLADCGFMQDAKIEALSLIESAIGRRLQ